MFTFKSLSTLAFALASTANIHAATAYIYTFEFDPLESLLGAVIQYAGQSLPSPDEMINMQYLAGNVNGCRPSTIEAYFNNATTLTYGTIGGYTTDCTRSDGVVGFEFVVKDAFSPGIFPATSVGRGVQDGDVTRFYYGGGQLTITEQPAGPQEPVPEPGAAVLVGAALLLLPLLRTRIA